MSDAAATAREVVSRYFDAFNAGDTQAMLALVTEDVEHHVNQGGVRHGRIAFAEFNAHMARCYAERLEEIVVMVAEDGARAAAEFVVHGEYRVTDAGLPPAHGQRYTLPAGTFFALRGGRIARIATCYNLQDWIRQVSR